jgi:hypothetical protein
VSGRSETPMRLRIDFDLSKPELRKLYQDCYGNPVEFMRRAAFILCGPPYSPQLERESRAELAGFNTPNHAEVYAAVTLKAVQP